MPRSIIRIFIFALVLLLPGACKTPVQEIAEKKDDPVKEKFVDANRYMGERHQDQISAFVDRMGWEMTQTPTGLWIMIKNHGQGPAIIQGERIHCRYTVSLLDGTVCYQSGEDKPEDITLGKGQMEAGAEEGILMMHHGDEAVMIIPPHLAHGNFGDRNKIPGASVIMYDILVD